MTVWTREKVDAFGQLVGALLASGGWYLFPQGGAWFLLPGLASYGVRWWKTGRLRTATGMDYLLIFFLATALIGVGTAYDKPTAWAKFWLIVGAVLLFEAFRAEEVTRFVPALFSFLGITITLYFLFGHNWEQYPGQLEIFTQLGKDIQKVLPQMPATWHRLHPNVVGGLLAFTLPFAALVHPKKVAAIGLGVILCGLVLTGSRGAWLASAGAGILGGWGWIVGQLPISNGKRRWAWLAGVVSGTVGVIVLLLALPTSGWQSLLTTERLALYRQSRILLEDYFLWGGGLGNFMMLHASYGLLTHVGYAVHAHHLFLDLGIEQGIMGMLSFFIMGVITAAFLWRVAKEGRLQPLVGAAALAWTTVWGHGLVDDVFYGSRAVLLLFVPLAFITRNMPALSPNKKVVQSWLLAATILFALAPKRAISVVWANLGAVEQSRIELSNYVWPDDPIQDAVRRQVDLGLAIGRYEQALDWNGENFTANRRLGQIALSQGDYAQALAYLQVAYRVRPTDGTTQQLLGEAYLLNGQLEAGQAMLQRVNNQQGQLQIRAFWYELVGEAESAGILRQLAQTP